MFGFNLEHLNAGAYAFRCCPHPNVKASARIDEEVKATASSMPEAERIADSDSPNVTVGVGWNAPYLYAFYPYFFVFKNHGFTLVSPVIFNCIPKSYMGMTGKYWELIREHGRHTASFSRFGSYQIDKL